VKKRKKLELIVDVTKSNKRARRLLIGKFYKERLLIGLRGN